MNFQLAAIGHSFRGSMAYYLHDKRQDADAPHPTTAERVAWTETRNLATEGPHTATRIMIATAESADQLKAAAGVKATGRKATRGPVFAFSLQWRGDELAGVDDTRAEMTRAADHALKLLGLDGRQAILVAHAEKAHPHVHVVCNLVSAEDGRRATINPNSVRALDRWADRYERERGQIVSPNRAEKYDRMERDRQKHPDADRRRDHAEARVKRQKEQQAEKVAAAKRQEAQRRQDGRATEPHPADVLKALGDDMKRQHRAAWPALTARHKTEREAIYGAYGERIKDATARHKDMSRPLWSQHFRAARQEAERFKARESETLGIIANALAAAKQQQASGQVPGRGLLSLTFANMLSADRRAQAFTAQQDARRIEVARQLRRALDDEQATIRAARADALEIHRKAAEAARVDLRARQDADWIKHREAWKHVPGRQPYHRARPDAAPIMPEPQAMRDRFDNANRLAQANPSRHPTERRHVSQSAPAPSPAGDLPMQARTVQDVPKKPEPVMPQVRSTAPAAKDWTRAAAPPATPAPVKDWSRNAAEITTPATPPPAKDWSAKPERAQPIRPLPTRTRDRDRER